MKLSKIKFIKKYGTDVKVKRFSSGTFTEVPTKALLGRGSKSNSTMRLLETLKEGIFLPDDDIDSGYFVENLTQKEMYVVGGTHPEYGVNETLSIVANLLMCNSAMTVKGTKKVADTRGNMKTEFVEVCKDLPCHLQEVTNELRQFEAGIHPDTEYQVYTTAIDITETDQVIVSVGGRSEAFKVIAKDYVTFPNMVKLQVCRDIRK